MHVHHKLLIQQSFASIAPDADAAATLFYSRLFTLDPTLRLMFRGDLHEQGRKLMQMLQFTVAGLDRLDTLIPAVQALGHRYASYGIQHEDYATIGEALIWTFEQGLGPEFSPEMRSAWIEFYLILATTMQAATDSELQPA